MLAIAHWPHTGRINSSSPTFRRRYVRRLNGFSFRLLIFAVLDYILTSSLSSGLDTVSLTVLFPFQYLVFHIITLYFHSIAIRPSSCGHQVVFRLSLYLVSLKSNFPLFYILFLWLFICFCTVFLILISGSVGSWLIFRIFCDLSEDKPGKSRLLRF